ncbi:DUF6185 family protein [Streptomyces coeruleorubidus]
MGLTRWTIRFKAPEALRPARWGTVDIDPGHAGPEWARPEPSAGGGAHALVWKPSTGPARSIPEIEVGTTPPWQQRQCVGRLGRDRRGRHRAALVSSGVLSSPAGRRRADRVAVQPLYDAAPAAAMPRDSLLRSTLTGGHLSVPRTGTCQCSVGTGHSRPVRLLFPLGLHRHDCGAR